MVTGDVTWHIQMDSDVDLIERIKIQLSNVTDNSQSLSPDDHFIPQ